MPITFVRPSIIESAVVRAPPGLDPRLPHGGADHRLVRPRPAARVPRRPRGHRRRHPGRHGGGGHPGRGGPRAPSRDAPQVYHVASGVRNPLRYGRLVELVDRTSSARNPLYDDRGQPINVPDWSFPGRGRVQRQLKRADTVMSVRGEAAHCPADPGQAGAAGRPDRGASRPGQAGPRLRRALRRLHRDRRPLPGRQPARAVGACDDERPRALRASIPASIDWDHYVHEIHLPSVLEHTRVRTKPGKSVVDKRPDRQRKAILSPDRHLAVFDLEHTLMSSNVVDTYAWLASRHLSPARRARFVAELVRQGPSLLALDRRDRGDFLRAFYRRFEDAPGRAAARGLLGALPPPAAHAVVPRRLRPGARASRRSGTAPCSSPARWTSSSSPSGRSSTTSSARGWSRATGGSPAT